MKRLGQILLVGALALHGHAAAAQDSDAGAIVARAAEKYRAITSFRSDFRQVIADSMIGTYESRGQLTQAGESRLAMRFSDPKGDAIVMDGKYLWVYTPSTTPGQVLRYQIPSDPTYGPNMLAWILTNPTARYRSRYVRADAVVGRAVDVISMTPLDRSLPFSEAIVWIDQYDSLPRRIEVREKSGQRRTLVLTGVETGRSTSDDTFRFDVPTGVRIVDQ